jgi:hypothetical protein
MPIARIITPDPGCVAPVEEQLRGLGYQVEIIAPQETVDTVADLVITVEKCPASEALKRARKLARQTDTDVFIAPGAVTESEARASTMANLVARGRAAWANAVQRRQRVAPLSLGRAADEEQTSATVATPAPAVIQSEADVPMVAAAVDLPAEAVLTRAPEPLIAPRPEPPAQHEPAVLGDTATPKAPSAWNPRQWKPQPLTLENSVPEEALVPEGSVIGPLPDGELDRAEAAPEPEVAPGRRAASEIFASVTRQGRAAVNYASGIALALATMKLRRRERKTAPRIPAVTTGKPRLRIRERDWRIAALVASAITIVVMLVWAGLENRRPASPIPAGALSTGIQQQVPFGPVTLPAKPVAPTATPVHTRTAARKPTPLRAAQAKPSRRSRRVEAEDDEVVVRHFAAQRASTQSGRRDAVKRYSDME